MQGQLPPSASRLSAAEQEEHSEDSAPEQVPQLEWQAAQRAAPLSNEPGSQGQFVVTRERPTPQAVHWPAEREQVRQE